MGFFDAIFNSSTAKKSNYKANFLTRQETSKVPGFNEEFSTDFPFEFRNQDIISYSKNGVELHNLPEMLKLNYNGLLAKSGAQEIYAVVGYGSNSNWDDVGYFPMQKTAQQNFEMLTFRKKQDELNIAFKDGAGNWDNNSGKNYVFYNDSVGSSR